MADPTPDPFEPQDVAFDYEALADVLDEANKHLAVVSAAFANLASVLRRNAGSLRAIGESRKR